MERYNEPIPFCGNPKSICTTHWQSYSSGSANSDAVEEEKPASGGGAKPSGTFIEFMKEVGDKKVTNPDTGNQAKVKSLKGEKGKALVRKEFKRWLEDKKRKEEQAKEPPKAKEPEPKKEDAKEPEPKKKRAPRKKKEEPAAEWMSYGDIDSWVNKDYKAVRKKWSAPQRDALNTYTGSAYETINNTLRQGKIPSSYKDTVEALDTLFNSPNGKTPKPMRVRRGVGSYHPLVQALQSGQLEPGQFFEDPGYQSTALVATSTWGGDYHMEIEVPKGARAVYVGEPPSNSYDPDAISRFPGEMELMMDRNTKLEVVAIEGSKIKMRVVLPSAKSKKGSERAALIRMASTLPVGDPDRREILTRLSTQAEDTHMTTAAKKEKPSKDRNKRFIDDGKGIVLKDKDGKPVKLDGKKSKKGSEREALIRMASSLPVGDPDRRAILSSLKGK